MSQKPRNPKYGMNVWKSNEPQKVKTISHPIVKPFEGKSALCFFGQPRTMDYCFPSIKKQILDVNHPDVFIVSDSQEVRIKELYNPVAMEIYSVDYVWKQVGNKQTKYVIHDWRAVPEKDVSLSWKTLQCEKLLFNYEKEHGKYDLVMLGRFDTKFLYVQTITKPEENTLYVPYINACLMPPDESGHHFDGISAHFCWATSDTMHKLMKTYLYLDEYYKEADAWLAEKLLDWMCKRNNIITKFVDVSLMLIRGTSDKPTAFYKQSLQEFPEFLRG